MSNKKVTLESRLFTFMLVILFMGLLAVYSASSFRAELAYGDSDYYLIQDFYRVVVGLLLFALAARVDYKVWLKLSPVLLVVCAIALIYLLVSTGVTEVRGSKRWLTVGKFRIQPSDLTRLALVLFLSLSLGSRNLRGLRDAGGFYLHLALVAAIAFLIFRQPDAGTALLLTSIALVMFFIAGERLRHLATVALAALPALAWLLYRMDGYQKGRILNFYESFLNGNVPWQIDQSLIAFGVGHIFGVGVGGSTQKYGFLPDAHTDFIYAIIGEEFGLVGTLTVIILFVLLMWTGIKIMSQVSDVRAKLLSFGIVFSIGLYAMINACVVLNLLPTTGIPMPFLSYGGSALLTNMFGMGILVNIAGQIRKEHRKNPMLVRFQTRTFAKQR